MRMNNLSLFTACIGIARTSNRSKLQAQGFLVYNLDESLGMGTRTSGKVSPRGLRTFD